MSDAAGSADRFGEDPERALAGPKARETDPHGLGTTYDKLRGA